MPLGPMSSFGMLYGWSFEKKEVKIDLEKKKTQRPPLVNCHFTLPEKPLVLKNVYNFDFISDVCKVICFNLI